VDGFGIAQVPEDLVNDYIQKGLLSQDLD